MNYGLFKSNNGYITNLALENINISILALDISAEYTYNVGGIAGYNYYGVITRSYVVGSIKVSNVYTQNIGGIVGRTDIGIIEEVYTKGEINSDAIYASRIGGIIGLAKSGGNSIIIKNVYSEIDIKASDWKGGYGGIIGDSIGGTVFISNAYYTGNIDNEAINRYGDSIVGGMVGLVNYTNMNIKDSYTTYKYFLGLWWTTYHVGKVENSYLVGENTGTSMILLNQNVSDIEITRVDSLVGYEIETNLGWDNAIWDFSTDNPTLINLDNTPVYTPDE